MEVTHTTISRSLIRGILFAAVLCLLFSGSAGAANLGTYFVYQDVSAFNLEEGKWTCGDNSIQITNGGIYPQGTFVAGTYERGGNTISVISPDVKYGAVAKINNADYLVQTGGIVYSGSDLSVSVISPVSDIPIEQIILYKPDGTTEYFASAKADMKISGIGNYRIEVIFPTNAFVEGMIPVNAASKFTFKCIDINPSISASADTLYRGEAVRITVEGTPGMEYLLNVNGFEIPENQLIALNPTETPNQYSLTIPNTGKASFSAKVNTNQNLASLELVGVKNGELEFIVQPNVVTAKTSQYSYFIGDEVTITGTSSVAKSFTFSISGYYVDETDLTEYITAQTNGKNWEVTFSTEDFVSSNGKKLDAGTYTVHVKEGDRVVSTVVIPLKLPLITLTSLPEVSVVGSTLSITGNAKAAKVVMYYIFGPNIFKTGAVKVEETLVEDTYQIETTYQVDILIDNTYTPGQYFLVVQHPMYDGKFNVYPDGSKIMMKLDSSSGSVVLFDVYDRQTAHPDRALCDALDSQNIDDTYVKGSFLVVGKDATFSISDIPSKIVKDSQLVISGVSTVYSGKTVLVEFIATDCLGIPKEILDTNEYLPLTAKIADDGTWKVTANIDSLDAGDYQLNISCESNVWKSVTLSVIGVDFKEIPLNKGWNFISVPKYLDSSCDTAGELLGSLETDGISPLGYDAKTGWYVLKADTAVNTPPAKTVYKGWNAVGLSAEKPMTAKSAFSNLDWVRCMPWDTEQSKWGTVIVNGGSSENSAELKLELGNGHWLYVEADGTYLGNTA